MNFTTCCGLLLLLGATTTTLAQPHPPKKRSCKPVPVQQGRTRQEEAEDAFLERSYETYARNRDCSEIMRRSAQPEPVNTNPVYTYVEQMPTLHGRSDFRGITAAIQQQLALPPDAPTGRTFVQFVVSKEGLVTQAHIVKGLRADLDSAVVVATRKLPRFTPGKQGGQVVPVSFTLLLAVPAQQR
jgi:hypothetical protein